MAIREHTNENAPNKTERGKYWRVDLFERMSVEEYEAVRAGEIDGSELIAWYVERGQTDSYLGRTTLGGDF
ncbi:hypothetical protein [Halogeometricum luteum]|uniref:Uncharacterized protein n=1 Tax=Halogeometricum luteum TaxID=2950537 RepID=A0ABU2G9G8_9EURY|nr:hypothetical protein [Halogeometricum sp. S3BR5-2]MDS0297111.1 hypothetical protein [Halogeometricum sp. S3BR5-2]